MEPIKVRSATASEQERTIHTIMLAFSTDPVARWCWSSSLEYVKHMPGFTVAFGGRGFRHGSAHCTDDGTAAALWLPPGEHPDEETMGELIERTVPDEIQGDLNAVFEQMAGFHPDEPHWYLPMIGVDPAYQGKGYGGALLKHALRKCDETHTPAYLESSNPRNIPLYQRHGFETIGEVQVGTSPTVVPMLRMAR